MELIENWGLEKIWKHPKFEIYNVKRQQIEK